MLLRLLFLVGDVFQSTVHGDEGEEEDEADDARDERRRLDHDRVPHEPVANIINILRS